MPEVVHQVSSKGDMWAITCERGMKTYSKNQEKGLKFLIDRPDYHLIHWGIRTFCNIKKKHEKTWKAGVNSSPTATMVRHTYARHPKQVQV